MTPPNAGNYRVIYSDPPWQFKPYSMSGLTRAPDYYTMTIDDICALPVGEWAAKDAALFLWVVQAQLPEALRVIEAWNFTFKTVGFAWVKIKGKQDRLFYAGEDVRMGREFSTSRTQPQLLSWKGA